MIWTWDVIRRIIEVLWLINIGFAIWTVFRSRRDIAATWAWLLVLSVFPVVGFILYMFVGRQLSHDDIFTIQEEQAKYQNTFLKKQHQLLEKHELLPQSNQKPRARMLANLNLNNDEALLTFDNRVEVFTDGHAKFEQLIDAINNATKNWIEKCILATPTVDYASYYKSTSRYFKYSYVTVKWSEVENATSYKVRVTKADGSYKEYDTTYTAFYSTNYTDDFIANGMDGATVSVRAYGDNDTFGCWSDDATVTKYGF